jgi:hypothetical protein
MELTNILSGQAIRFFQTSTPADWFFPDAAAEIQRRYSFVDSPRTSTSFNPNPDGVEFKLGHYKSAIIGKATIFTDGIVVEAATATEKIDEFIDDIWVLLAELGATVNPTTDKARCYISRVEVRAEIEMSVAFKKFTRLSDAIAKAIKMNGLSSKQFEVSALVLSAEKADSEVLSPGRFTFERRAGRGFSENMFFSEAPVPTTQHLHLLDVLETLL